jgi:hypothetical protein
MLFIPLLLSCSLSINSSAMPLDYGHQDCNVIELDTSQCDYVPPAKNRTIRPGCDAYENNDCINDAINLCPSNYYSLSSYNFCLNANIDCGADQYSDDVDYFYFKLFVDSYVEFEIDVPDCDNYLDYILLKDDYSFDGTRFYTSYSNYYLDFSLSFCKEYSSCLEPGTYVIYIKRSSSSYEWATIDYSLDFSVAKKTSGYGSHTIGKLVYNKGLQGAYWRNDFIPLNRLSNFYDTTSYVYNKGENEDQNYALNELESLIPATPFLLEEFYLWGSEIKSVFYAILNEIKTCFFTNYNANEIRRLEITRDTVGNTITISCYIGSLLVSSCPPISVSLGTIGALGPIISNKIFDIFIPKVGVSDLYFSYVLGLYMGVLLNSPDNEIIYLPIYGTLDFNDNILPSLREYTFTTEDSLEIIANDVDIVLYNDDCIYSLGKGPSYLKGKIYGLTADINSSDFDLIEDIQDVSPTVNLFNEAGGHFGTLFQGGYYWLSFTASSTQNYFFHFQSTPTEGFFVEQYSNVTTGYSTSGIIHSFAVNATITSTSQKAVFFSLSLIANATVYFRIMGIGLCPLSIDYGLGDISAYITHVHDFSYMYSWRNLNQHNAFCACGVSTLQGHVVSAGFINNYSLNGGVPTAPCLLCGGLARIGFLPGALNSSDFNNDGYMITNDGIIIINDLE